MINMISKTISHYKIIEKLGEGGMGIVYKAEDLKLDRTVVLKFLPAELSLDAEAKKRFFREAKMASALDHPNICTIHEIDTTDEGQIFIVMAYCEGETLQEKLAKGLLSIKEAVNIAIQIAQGLERAYKIGIIHRDIKPANIIISPEKRVKIIDFGLAKTAGQAEITKKTSSIGTTAYMSPQQICAEKIDQRSDIWSLGVIIYEMLSGKLPFRGDYEAAVIYSILSEDPAPVSEIRPEVNDVLSCIIGKALTKDPQYRYKSAKQLLSDLENFQLGSFENVSVLSDQNKSDLRGGFRDVYKRNKVKILSVGILVVILSLVFVLLFGRPLIQENMIVVDKITINDKSVKDAPLIKEMIEYLLTDDLLQSSTNKNILSRKEFNLLYPKNIPEMFIGGDITTQDYGFILRVSINKPRLGLPFNFFDDVHYISDKIYDESNILTEVIPKISQQIFGLEKKKSTFTKLWDAYVNFYQGELAWQKLDIPKAKLFYQKALDIDPSFILAKLRLASVLSFEVINVYASELVTSIRPYLNMLSEIDSLRAEALSARVSDDFQKEISILRKIYNRFPSRKETAYEVAEAYYRVCDIQNAIDYYKKALILDKDYALAHNHLGYCYTHRGMHEEAIKHFRIYLELDSTANAYDSLGDGYMVAGLLDSAQWALGNAIKLDSSLSYIYWSLFEVRIRQGKINEALSATNKYIYYTYSPDAKARGLFFKGLAKLCKNELNYALQYCELALQTHDASDVFSRNHELHWLLARIYLRLNKIKAFERELSQMKNIIKENNINETLYRRYIYKYYNHLKACQAARFGKLGDLKNIINLFNGPIKNKVSDAGSLFDLAFFNTAFAEILMESTIERYEMAEQCLLLALDYNPNYALAHYQLAKLYEKKKYFVKAKYHVEKFLNLWKDADKDLPELIDGKKQLNKLKGISTS
jgi:serine/threonine protein kinase